jgi:hypothetical protein
MMVTTKYKGPTNARGSGFRVVIFDHPKISKFISYNYRPSNAAEAAVIEATGKTPRYIGQLGDGTEIWEI